MKCREEVKEGRVMKEVRTVELACKLRRRLRTRPKEKRRAPARTAACRELNFKQARTIFYTIWCRGKCEVRL